MVVVDFAADFRLRLRFGAALAAVFLFEVVLLLRVVFLFDPGFGPGFRLVFRLVVVVDFAADFRLRLFGAAFAAVFLFVVVLLLRVVFLVEAALRLAAMLLTVIS